MFLSSFTALLGKHKLQGSNGGIRFRVPKGRTSFQVPRGTGSDSQGGIRVQVPSGGIRFQLPKG